ncbi:MAG: hydrogen gas-evolving membrane-bound hydrogenase subunit E [Microbacterium sp.]
MVALFATSGAPDLALTRILVETVTLMRPDRARAAAHPGAHERAQRVGVAGGPHGARRRGGRDDGDGGARGDRRTRGRTHLTTAAPDRYDLGHGKNVVDVALVDLRGWDTMGELSVLILAATGVACRVRDAPLRPDLAVDLGAPHRGDTHPPPPRRDFRRPARTHRRVEQHEAGMARRRSAHATREPLDHARGDRARALPHDHRRVDLPALRGRNLPGGVSAAASSPAWPSSCATSPAGATSWAPRRRRMPGACSAPE